MVNPGVDIKNVKFTGNDTVPKTIEVGSVTIGTLTLNNMINIKMIKLSFKEWFLLVVRMVGHPL